MRGEWTCRGIGPSLTGLPPRARRHFTASEQPGGILRHPKGDHDSRDNTLRGVRVGLAPHPDVADRGPPHRWNDGRDRSCGPGSGGVPGLPTSGRGTSGARTGDVTHHTDRRAGRDPREPGLPRRPQRPLRSPGPGPASVSPQRFTRAVLLALWGGGLTAAMLALLGPPGHHRWTSACWPTSADCSPATSRR